MVSRVPSRWYSLYDGDFFQEMFRALALWHAEAHCPDVTPVGEKFLKRDLISEGFEMIVYNLESSAKLLFYSDVGCIVEYCRCRLERVKGPIGSLELLQK